jgi:hypothetical protein
MKLQVYALCGYSAAPATSVSTRVGYWLNEGHRRILRNPALTELRQSTLCFSSEEDVSIYAVPQIFERIDAIVQQSNNLRLVMMSRDTYRTVDPGETAIGTPTAWVPAGFWPVIRQPNETGLWVASTSAADTTQSVIMQGATSTVAAAGQPHRSVTITLNGVTRVQFGTDTTYSLVQFWRLSAEAVGTVYLYDAASGGNILARIQPGLTTCQYLAIRLWPTPSSNEAYYVDGQYEIPNLIGDTDIPLLPPSYHDLLMTYAVMKEYERTQDPRYPMALQQFTEGEKQLLTFVQFPPDYKPVAGSMSERGFTNLPGGWFPSDASWP